MVVPLVHKVAGPEDVPVYVLIHGMGSRAATWVWDDVVSLMQGDSRLIAVDLRGHGESPQPGSYKLTEMADDVAGLLDDLGVESATIVGHSMGGIVALNLAQRRPDLVKDLVLEDSPPPPREGSKLLGDGIFGDPVPYDFEIRPELLRELRNPNPEWAGRIGEIKKPVLVIGGGETGGVDQRDLKNLAAELGAEFTTIDVGHNVHRDRPEEFVGKIRDWKKRIAG